MALVVGTKKGLFLFQSDRQRARWRLSGPFLNGLEINHATLDPRSGTLYATANNPWFGNKVAISPDLGRTWRDNKSSPRFAEGSGLVLERLWRIEPGRASEPGVLYCGVAPAALFRSEDDGETWAEVKGLNQHPTRKRWNPGAGGMCLHSIVLDQKDRRRMWVAISAAGVFRSDDGGESWQPRNSSLKDVGARYDPKLPLYPEVGQCIHHLVRSPGRGGRLYAQSHQGTYRSDDGAETWTEITEGLPSDFGMAMAAHPRNANVAWVVPLQGGEFRCPPEGKLRVYRTASAGKRWEALTQGLPQKNAYMGMYREGLAVDSLEPAGLYLGTNTGQMYLSADEGDSWRRLTAELPPISSVNVTVLG